MYSRETEAFWNKLKKEVILCLQIRQAVAGKEEDSQTVMRVNINKRFEVNDPRL